MQSSTFRPKCAVITHILCKPRLASDSQSENEVALRSQVIDRVNFSQ